MKADVLIPDLPPVDGHATHFAGLESTDRAVREEIQHRAYAIWQGEGEPDDRQLAHWLAAETEVMRVS